tara:strand:+ start:1582 stop:2172 length:591 start_codon:yes stop_codon:yes gene_type:complete
MATEIKKTTFDVLSAINVNDHTKKKGNFTYLSWAFAWEELKKVSPSATSKVYHDENTNMPYFESKAGVMVKVGVTIDGLEHINYLPVMNFKNAAIAPDNVTMMDVNKTIQRCTVKAIALHGLALYIYTGEDLPTEDKVVEVPTFIVLKNGDKNWETVVKYISKSKDKGADKILAQLRTKYTISKSVETLITKLVNL